MSQQIYYDHTFCKGIDLSSLLFVKFIRYHDDVLYLVQDESIYKLDKVRKCITFIFDLDDPEDSIKSIFFVGDYEIILTSCGKIIVLNNWVFNQKTVVNSCSKVCGACLSPNACCLALITSNKLCQVNECELKIFTGLRFMNFEESKINKDLVMSKFNL